MSERRKDFMKHKENIPPAARGNAEWCGATWILPWWQIIGRWVGEICSWGGKIGERSGLMVSA